MQATTDAEALTGEVLKGVFRLLGKPELQQVLRDDARYPQALAELGLPPSLVVRERLLEIVNRAGRGRVAVASPSPSAASTDSGSSSAAAFDESDPVARILLGSFGHINRSFNISLTMSVVLFAVGLLLLAMAVYRSFLERD